MGQVNFTDLRGNMAAHFDRIEADRTELIVTRQNHEPMVILALSEWEGMLETLHLLSTPANADRLLRSIAELEAGRGEVPDLLEEGRSCFRRMPGRIINSGSSAILQAFGG